MIANFNAKYATEKKNNEQSAQKDYASIKLALVL